MLVGQNLTCVICILYFFGDIFFMCSVDVRHDTQHFNVKTVSITIHPIIQTIQVILAHYLNVQVWMQVLKVFKHIYYLTIDLTEK